jgi:hypothetical protein
MFWKLDLFPSSGEGGKTPTLLGPLERANLIPSPEDRNRSSFRMLCFLVSRIPDDEQSPKTVILTTFTFARPLCMYMAVGDWLLCAYVAVSNWMLCMHMTGRIDA